MSAADYRCACELDQPCTLVSCCEVQRVIEDLTVDKPELLYQVTLPAPPPLNVMYRYANSRVLKSKPYRDWLREADVLMHSVAGWPPRCLDEVTIDIVAQPKDRRIRDVDSYAKPILDLLELRVLGNDQQVAVLHVERLAPPAAQHTVSISIYKYDQLTTAT